MAEQHKNLTPVDIVIVGAGIAGLWTFNRLKRAGYDAVLVESNAIGSGQTIASQGIIHSGLKYAFAGKINALARSISAMPDLWRMAMRGEGPVDLSAAWAAASSQYLLIPSGFMGGLVKLVAQKALDGNVREVEILPDEIKVAGFKGSVVYMDEPVMDIPSVIRALAAPYKNFIRKIRATDDVRTLIPAKIYIYTAAGSNRDIAEKNAHTKGLETQQRPLLMAMMKNAPFEIYAHLVGTSEKPVATITTHKMKDGTLVWYIGGGIAECKKETNPEIVCKAAQNALLRYMPDIDLSRAEWSTLPIDRIEGKSTTQGWMPDAPTLHAAGDSLYCWPTKLTFAPLLSDMIVEELQRRGIAPSNKESNFSFLPEADYAQTPWDTAQWTKEHLARQA